MFLALGRETRVVTSNRERERFEEGGHTGMRLNGLAIRAQSSARRAEVFSGLQLIKPTSRCVKKSLGDVNETMDGRSRSAPRVFPDGGTAVSYSVFLLWLFIHLFISNHWMPFVNYYIYLTFSPHKLQLFYCYLFKFEWVIHCYLLYIYF